jgi:hypothetical protein
VSTRVATVIAGVSICSDERRLKGDRFDIALSPDGIEIRRPGQPTRQLSWDHVSEWEIEDRGGGVVLTLRGGGAVTPLVVPRWTVDELEAVLRDVTTQAPTPAAPEEVAVREVAPAPVVAAEAVAESEAEAEAVAADVTEPAVEPAAEPEPSPEPQSEPTGGEGKRRRRLSPWKVVVTVTLLAVLATAVTLVLLQSAGVINLNFLGPTA